MHDRKKPDTRPDPATAPQISLEHTQDRALTADEHSKDRFWLKAIFLAIVVATGVVVFVFA